MRNRFQAKIAITYYFFNAFGLDGRNKGLSPLSKQLAGRACNTTFFRRVGVISDIRQEKEDSNGKKHTDYR